MELTDAEIDAAILRHAEDRWLKVARIAGQTLHALGADGRVAERAFEKRLAALVASGKLDAQGDIKQWRYSEIRLPAASPRRGSSPRTRS